MRRVRVLGWVAVVALAVSGCGDAQAGPDATEPTPTPGQLPTALPQTDSVLTSGFPVTVIDDGTPHACFGGVAASLPPQCGDGVPLVGWHWESHEGTYEEASGVRFGSFTLTGTFDGTTLTVTDAVDAASYDGPSPAPEPPPTTPCPVPEGGWQPIDAARSNQAALGRTTAAAKRLDGYALLWVDQSINPAWPQYLDGDFSDEVVSQLNDPQFTILNVEVTGDPATAEATLRETWGGSLCVTTADHTAEELSRAQEGVNRLPGFMGSGQGGIDNTVDLMVVYDDGTLQRWADATYGKGVVLVNSALHAVD